MPRKPSATGAPPLHGRARRRVGRASVLSLALALALSSTAASPIQALDEPEAPNPSEPTDPAGGTSPVVPFAPEVGAGAASDAQTDRVIVRWSRAGDVGQAADASRVAILERASGRPARFVRTTATGGAVYDLGGRLGSEAPSIVARLQRLPGVATVEPDRWFTVDADMPEDPRGAELWGLLGAPDSPFGIDVLDAWDVSRGAGVVVAVVDTGIVTHPDLAGRTLPGYDFAHWAVSNDGDWRDPNPADPGDACNGAPSTWHGTHVAGTIAAVADNGTGVFGGAPDAMILPVRALGVCGGYETDIADAIRWSAGGSVAGVPTNPNPAKVINLSLAGWGDCSTEYLSAIADARVRGAVVVASAGNSSWFARYQMPANCPGVMTVGATGQDGVRAAFSNFGPELDLSAPGVGVLSTTDSGTGAPVGPDYRAYDGTSMAAPHVSLSAAILSSFAPGVSGDGIAAVLAGTPSPLAPHGYCDLYGCGRGIVSPANAIAALQAATPFVGRPVPAAPYVAPGQSLAVESTIVDVDGVALARVSLDGGAWQSMSAVDGTAFGAQSVLVRRTIIAPIDGGTHEVCVRGRDALDNLSVGTCATFVVDTTPPELMGPTAPPTSASGVPAVISATATDALSHVARVEGSLDGGPWAPMPPRDAWDGNEYSPTEVHATVVNGRADELTTGNWATCTLHGTSPACWGYNAGGQLGDGTFEPRGWPAGVPGLPPTGQISAGSYHTCALATDGTVRCWGHNGHGEIGDGSSGGLQGEPTPHLVSSLADVVQISSGGFHTCALLPGGAAKCWGYNAFGQLGDGTTETRTTPVSVTGLSGAVALSASPTGGEDAWPTHTCALMADTTVQCWGDNRYGQLGDGTQTSRSTPGPVGGLVDVLSVRAGGAFTCALLAGGTVKCWGYNLVGEIGDGTTVDRALPVPVTGLTDVVAIDADFGHACALRRYGTVWCWGWNGGFQLGEAVSDNSAVPVEIVGLTDAVALGTGTMHNCVLTSIGATRCWGLNAYYQLGTGDDEDPLFATRPGDVVGLTGPLAPGGAHEACAAATDIVDNAGDVGCVGFVVTPDATSPGVRHLLPVSRSSSSMTTISWALAFSEPVVGLSAADFEIGGTSAGWSIGSVSGSGAGPYSIELVGTPDRTGGTVSLALDANAVIDAAGNPGPSAITPSASVAIVYAGAPTARFRTGPSASTLGVRVTWPAATGAGGIAAYELEMRTDEGAWIEVPLGAPTTRAADVALAANRTYRFRVRATDMGGATSAWEEGREVNLRRVQETHRRVSYTGTWTYRSLSGASGNAVAHTYAAGRMARLTFTGDTIAYISTLSPARGKVAVYLDGARLRVLDLYAPVTQPAQVVFAKTVPFGTHTIELRVLGTRNASSSSSRIDVDAFALME